MSKIIFESGLELNCELVELERRYSHGADRECLVIHLTEWNNTDLKTFASTNLISGTITIKDNDNDYVYTNYEIFHELKYNGTEYVLIIAQLTAQEIKYNELLKRIEALEK